VAEFTPTRHDYESVDRAVAHLQARGWRFTGINDLVDAWEELVEHVESGYNDDPAELHNDASCRTALAEVLPLLSDPVAGNIRDRLGPLDERYRAATLGPALMPSDATNRWWTTRDPKPVDPTDQ
jgi:hypothetical protein